MDDGSSPLWAVMVFLLFIIINGILYGFGSAIQKVSESEVEKRQQEELDTYGYLKMFNSDKE